MSKNYEIISRAADAAMKLNPELSRRRLIDTLEGIEIFHAFAEGALHEAEKSALDRNDGHFTKAMADGFQHIADVGFYVYQATDSLNNPMYEELVDRYKEVALTASTKRDFAPRQYPDCFEADHFLIVAQGPGELPCPHEDHISKDMFVIRCIETENERAARVQPDASPHRVMSYVKWLDGFDPKYVVENVLPTKVARDISIYLKD